MEKHEFEAALEQHAALIEAVRMRAHALHDSVGQTYDNTHPYWFHLDMVADFTRQYAHEVCASADDAPAIIFGAYFHDSIEDARLTYNNLLSIAREYFDEIHAIMATEIAYALTNEKGRTRAERANDRYYQGIRTTPYAPLVKLADRLANAFYSFSHSSAVAQPSAASSCEETAGHPSSSHQANAAMREVYTREMPHFLASIADPSATDPRLTLPASMLARIQSLGS